MLWLSGTKNNKNPPPKTLGILAFDAAKTMCRLVSLYKSLTDEEIFNLKNETLNSEGVVFFNSTDEKFLLNLACSERLEDLNQAAVSLSNLADKCSDFGLNRFDIAYSDKKSGTIGVRSKPSSFGSKEIKKLVEKMVKLISSTSHLYSAMESLQISERNSENRKKRLNFLLNPKDQYLDCLEQKKLESQRKEVKLFIETSLWNQTCDKIVALMARFVCIIYARIFTVFGPCEKEKIYNIRILHQETNYCLLKDREKHKNRRSRDKLHKKMNSKSGPIPKTTVKKELIRFPSGIPNLIIPENIGFGTGGKEKNNRVYKLAPASTVGGAGLSFRYANLILLAEMCLHAPGTIGDDAREELYEMLPVNIRTKVRAKLKNRKEEEEMDSGDGMAEGWRDALEEIMGWLGPLAHDTMTWQTERNLEKKKFETGVSTLLVQTLHYSDLEKTEAAIVEVLVGLSYIYRYDNRQSVGFRYGKRRL